MEGRPPCRPVSVDDTATARSGISDVVAESGHCEKRSDEAIQLDRHGALRAPRDDNVVERAATVQFKPP